MSEMKPAAWLIEASDGGRFLAFNDQSMGEPNGESLTALYTADQLAEAVAAERERCAKVCEDKISGTFPDLRNLTDADHRRIAWDAACEELAEAIRSAVK